MSRSLSVQHSPSVSCSVCAGGMKTASRNEKGEKEEDRERDKAEGDLHCGCRANARSRRVCALTLTKD